MTSFSRRHFALTFAAMPRLLQGMPGRVLRMQIAGEWCFLKLPAKPRNGQVVLILHGAGEWVSETSSSWEQQPGATKLIHSLLDAGYAVAQSNSASRHRNGMWGNADTQTTTAAFLHWLAENHGLRTLHAVAVSAGNLTLVNLLLGHEANFESAVMLAPCLSLASEYRCPGGVNRIKTIAEAYHFTPQSTCPGDPTRDSAFLRATTKYDPLRKMEALTDRQIRAAFGDIRLLAIYETHDPRVPPAENLLPFAARLKRARVPLQILSMEADTHGSQELFLRHVEAILAFIERRRIACLGIALPSRASAV